jgi:hypothetical protein
MSVVSIFSKSIDASPGTRTRDRLRKHASAPARAQSNARVCRMGAQGSLPGGAQEGAR